MGSTDVWRLLRLLLLLSSGSGADSSTLPSRNVFLVTDGHMTEEQSILQSKAFEPALISVKVMWQQFDENAPKPIQVVISCNNVIVVVQICYIGKYILL